MRFNFRLGIIALVAASLFSSYCEPKGDPMIRKRSHMMEIDLKGRDIHDPRVLNVMASVPRHMFVPKQFKEMAYDDRPLPIGEDQTISQPYIVALMTQSLELQPGDKVLEIGTGSGYQAAVLSKLVKSVFTIEIKENLAKNAASLLALLGYDNVTVKQGDGYLGWPEEAPFDNISVTAADSEVPKPLEEQLKEGGRLIMPVGEGQSHQDLLLGTKTDGKMQYKAVTAVIFVPMTGITEQN